MRADKGFHQFVVHVPGDSGAKHKEIAGCHAPMQAAGNAAVGGGGVGFFHFIVLMIVLLEFPGSIGRASVPGGGTTCQSGGGNA